MSFLSRVVAPTETKDPVAFLSRVEPPPGTKGSLFVPGGASARGKKRPTSPSLPIFSKSLAPPLIYLPLLSLCFIFFLPPPSSAAFSPPSLRPSAPSPVWVGLASRSQGAAKARAPAGVARARWSASNPVASQARVRAAARPRRWQQLGPAGAARPGGDGRQHRSAPRPGPGGGHKLSPAGAVAGASRPGGVGLGPRPSQALAVAAAQPGHGGRRQGWRRQIQAGGSVVLVFFVKYVYVNGLICEKIVCSCDN